MKVRYGKISLSGEIRDMVVADVALTIAFALIFSGGIGGLFSPSGFIYFVPIAFVAVTLSFVLHEYMHKIVAQKFGAIAAFRMSEMGVVITLVSAAVGFLIGIPGATMIYTSRFTQEEDGYVSLAGPLTNFAVFLVFLGISVYLGVHPTAPYIQKMVGIVMFISVWLAFFNMLPIYPLDGSKVLRWNKGVYAAMMIVTFLFLFSIVGVELVVYMVFALVVALFFSMMYSGMRLF